MKWDHIKVYLIIMLIIVNAFFAVTLYIQYRTNNYIPETELDQLSSLLRDGNIEIPDGVLSAKKQGSTVYGGVYSKTYYETAAELISGGSNSTSYTTPNGMNFIMRDTGDTYEFTYPFGIKYVYKGSQDSDYALDTETLDLTALTKVDLIRATYTLSTIKNFLYAGGKISGTDAESRFRIGLKTDAVYFDPKINSYIAYVYQVAGDQPIYGCGAYIAVNGNKVVFASGNLILCNLSESYNIELRDQVNLMLFEKRDLSDSSTVTEDSDAASQTTASDDSASGTDTAASAETQADTNTKKYILTSAENCLCITWNADRSKFYLLPGWKFTYNGSVVRIRSAADGSIYTK
jgi:hypothetical protein